MTVKNRVLPVFLFVIIKKWETNSQGVLKMIFAVRTEQQKKILCEIKEIRQELLTAKFGRKTVDLQLKELKNALFLAQNLKQEYVKFQESLTLARRTVFYLLESIGVRTAGVVKRKLEELNGHLEKLCYGRKLFACELDLEDTVCWLKGAAADISLVNEIMLRSELENLEFLLEDALERTSPDFLALAYFIQHENKQEFRNDFLVHYLYKNLMERLLREAEFAGCMEQLQQVIQNDIYESPSGILEIR